MQWSIGRVYRCRTGWINEENGNFLTSHRVFCSMRCRVPHTQPYRIPLLHTLGMVNSFIRRIIVSVSFLLIVCGQSSWWWWWWSWHGHDRNPLRVVIHQVSAAPRTIETELCNSNGCVVCKQQMHRVRSFWIIFSFVYFVVLSLQRAYFDAREMDSRQKKIAINV